MITRIPSGPQRRGGDGASIRAPARTHGAIAAALIDSARISSVSRAL